MGIGELIFYEEARQNCYRFLAVLFYLPQKTLFEENGVLKSLDMNLHVACPDAAVFCRVMEERFSSYSETELQVQYAKLFVGPAALIAPPYGSVYLEVGRRVMGESTMDVLEFYRAEGLAMGNECKELPDHIAVELEFMNFLVFQEIKAIKQYDFATAVTFLEKQERFLNNYLGWIPSFCAKVREGSENDFYRSLADCLEWFVTKCEVRNIGKIVQCSKALQKSCRSQVGEGLEVSTGD